MSVTIKGNNISMTRGDTLRIQVSIKSGEEEYVPQNGDVIRFYLKRALMTNGNKEFVDKDPIVTKTISNEDMLLELEPEDTKALDFGVYKYDLELTMSDGTVDTFIPNAAFVLTPEVG